MATVEENARVWGRSYQWSRGGDEWSDWWGGAEPQWSMSILPRIRAFLPASSVLEIGPGHGRWTSFLKGFASRLALVDVSPECLEACRDRFRDDRHVHTFLNDGMTLPFIEDRSIDFAFSFDSLVHAEADVLRSYLKEFARVLSDDGVAFIHHSNMGAYSPFPWWLGRVPGGRVLQRFGLAEGSAHWRARSVDAVRARMWIDDAKLRCRSQEMINWGTRRLIDCITVITRKGSRYDRPTTVLRNINFMMEARTARAIASTYA